MACDLIIDGREPAAVFSALSACAHTRENLEVGDFQISVSDVPVIIIERKSWSDLVASLSDNRMKEQTARLVAKCKSVGARPVLIVECAHVHGWEGATGGHNHKFIDCTLTKYAIEGFSVLRTKNIAHTASLVTWLFNRCSIGKVPQFSPTLQFSGHAGEQKFRKKDYDNPWEVMLTAVRGVSKKKAQDISKKFTNAKLLLHALEGGKTLDIKGIGKKLEGDIKAAFLGN